MNIVYKLQSVGKALASTIVLNCTYSIVKIVLIGEWLGAYNEQSVGNAIFTFN